MEKGLKKIGIIGFSFALEPSEPNPCNQRIAYRIKLIAEENPDTEFLFGNQWEVDLALKWVGLTSDLVVELPEDGSYLGSKEVWPIVRDQLFIPNGITEVVPVAQPFLQLPMVSKMIRADGFTVISPEMKLREIGFDKNSIQWWCRGPARTAAKAVMLKLGFQHGYHGMQSS